MALKLHTRPLSRPVHHKIPAKALNFAVAKVEEQDMSARHRATDLHAETMRSARSALARIVRQRHFNPDQVEFEAACPACGSDTTWTEERIETRVKVRIACPCMPDVPELEAWSEDSADEFDVPLLEMPGSTGRLP